MAALFGVIEQITLEILVQVPERRSVKPFPVTSAESPKLWRGEDMRLQQKRLQRFLESVYVPPCSSSVAPSRSFDGSN